MNDYNNNTNNINNNHNMNNYYNNDNIDEKANCNISQQIKQMEKKLQNRDIQEAYEMICRFWESNANILSTNIDATFRIFWLFLSVFKMKDDKQDKDLYTYVHSFVSIKIISTESLCVCFFMFVSV